MKKHLTLLCLILLSGCDQQAADRQTIKTTYAEIQKNFSANSQAANQLYENKSVELTDTVNSVKGAGTVILVDNSMVPYMVSMAAASRHSLSTLKPGDTLTVRCNVIDAVLLSACSVVN